MEKRKLAEKCLAFIDKSPSCFHAVTNIEMALRQAGYEKLEEKNSFGIKPGGKYFVVRNDSAVIAFQLPKGKVKGFHMIASHSDSPTFKIKEHPEMKVEDRYVRLNTERYGGMILSTWFDRPLSVAGRIVIKQKDKPVTKLVCIDRDLLVIPNLAIHINREMNKGIEYNPQTDMLPLFAGSTDGKGLHHMIAESVGIKEEDILGSDLFLYTRQKGCLAGAKEEFIIAPRLDDLQCAYGSLEGFLEAVPKEYANVYIVYDNEEIGSQTKQGAASTFLKDVLENIAEALGASGSGYKRMVAESFMISADNAHAVHPNHPEKSDPTNRPYLNGGIAIKYHGSQKYATDAISDAIMKTVCQEAKVPYQSYCNRSDVVGGSTLGNISTSQVAVATVDVGLPQLAMHSAVETAGTKDIWYLYRVARQFYSK